MKQTENEVEIDIIKWARSNGWRVRRNHVGVFYTITRTPIRIGTVGETDWLLIHPIHGAVWVETKATGKLPDKRQREFIALVTHLGFKACWVDSLVLLKQKFSEWGIPMV